jgi:hypothetical protein
VNPALADIEAIVACSGTGEAIEALLPAGARGRQLTAGTLIIGIILELADGRPAHLTRVLEALLALPEDDQKRLGVIQDWKSGPHQLTYRQVEYLNGLIREALDKDEPDGPPSAGLQKLCDQLLEASIPGQFKDASSSLAADWTDVQAWARAVPQANAGTGADPEARWGHRNVNRTIEEGEMFFGYYMPAATMINDEGGPPVPELVRRITVCSSAHDPAAALVPVLADMVSADGVRPGDILADSGFSHRQPDTWANPLRGLRMQLVADLHPQDRGPQGTHQGAVICNGNLYCPATPKPLLQLVPLPPGVSADQVATHDQQTAELTRYKLGLHAADDADGYRRLACPATAGKIRCPLRPASMTLDRSRPEILTPPQHPQACCARKTITAGPDIATKTRQKHDYPSAAWRVSYRRRTASERLNASVKDTATGSIDRGWIRLMGLTPLTLFLACMMIARNQRILAAWQARQDQDAHPAGQPPRRRTRHRRELASAATKPPKPAREPRATAAAVHTSPTSDSAAPPARPGSPETPATTPHARKPQRPRPHQRSRPDCQSQM